MEVASVMINGEDINQKMLQFITWMMMCTFYTSHACKECQSSCSVGDLHSVNLHRCLCSGSLHERLGEGVAKTVTVGGMLLHH